MSRNMVAIQKGLFGRLAAEVRRTDNERHATESLDADRFVSGNEEDKDALSHAKLLRLERVPGLGSLALIVWRGRYIFGLPSALVANADHVEDVTDSFTNSGLACLLFAEEETPLAVDDPLQLVEFIFGTKGEYKFETVSKFFPSFTYYWTRSSLDGSKLGEMWSRCQAFCASSMLLAHNSHWPPNSLALFTQACCGPAARVVGASLLAAAVAATWSHTFLEVYRAIEAVFPVICVEDLLKKLPAETATTRRTDLVEALEDALQWRLRQDATLERLIARLSAPDADAIGARLGVARDKVARSISRARNRVAHGALNQSPPDDRDRAALLSACLMLVHSAYSTVPVSELWLVVD